MRTSGINHVSIHANDLDESVRFYVELLDAELLDTPNFGIPVQWLGLGDTQLHVFIREAKAQSHHHFGLTVEDLEPVYRRPRSSARSTTTRTPTTSSSCPATSRRPTCAIPRATCSRSTRRAPHGSPEWLRAQHDASSTSSTRRTTSTGARDLYVPDPAAR